MRLYVWIVILMSVSLSIFACNRDSQSSIDIPTSSPSTSTERIEAKGSPLTPATATVVPPTASPRPSATLRPSVIPSSTPTFTPTVAPPILNPNFGNPISISNASEVALLQQVENQNFGDMLFSPDGRWIAFTDQAPLSTLAYYHYKLIDAVTGDTKYVVPKREPDMMVQMVGFTADSKELLVTTSINEQYTLEHWDVETGTLMESRVTRTAQITMSASRALLLHHDALYPGRGGGRKVLEVRRISDNSVIASFTNPNVYPYILPSVTSDDSYIVFHLRTNEIYICPLVSEAKVIENCDLVIPALPNLDLSAIHYLEFSPDASLLLVQFERTLTAFRTEDWSVAYSISGINEIDISPTEEIFAATLYTPEYPFPHEIAIYELYGGTLLHKLPPIELSEGKFTQNYGLMFDHSGQILLTRSEGFLHLWGIAPQ